MTVAPEVTAREEVEGSMALKLVALDMLSATPVDSSPNKSSIVTDGSLVRLEGVQELGL